jgi:hypothetical protein
MPKNLKYYAYISRSKVNQLHDQLKDFAVEKKSVKRSSAAAVKGEAGGMLGFFKAGVSADKSLGTEVEELGRETAVQKLATVLDYIDNNEKVLDLAQVCRERAGAALDAFCYVYEGSFYALGRLGRGDSGLQISAAALEKSPNDIVISKDLLIAPARIENALKEVGPNKSSLVSDMTIICSDINQYTVRLACSYKYFSDMGGEMDVRRSEWDVHPHSGNYAFFEGESDAYLRGVLFLNGIRGNTIMGTPLCLVYSSDPSLRI